MAGGLGARRVHSVLHDLLAHPAVVRVGRHALLTVDLVHHHLVEGTLYEGRFIGEALHK